MKNYTDKEQDGKSKSVADNLPKSHDSSLFPFQRIDERPEVVIQQKLKDTINNSARVLQLKAYQEMANESAQVKQHREYQTLADSFSSQTLQKKQSIEEEETSLGESKAIQRKENDTGLPDGLKSGVENLSGYSLNDVKVHYNSDKPAQLQAHAYAQGTDIHLGPGEEKHLPHEVWHVVQQKQGRVKPTLQMKSNLKVNNDQNLEKEADVMGRKAVQDNSTNQRDNTVDALLITEGHTENHVVQRMIAAREGSNRSLKNIYDQLVWRSLLLRALGYAVGNKKAIQLNFGTDEELDRRNACYLADKHAILVNQKFSESPESEIKKWILIELNHAREVLHDQESNEKIKMPENLEDHGNAEFKALEALRVEYHEWISSYLLYIQTKDINEHTPQSKKKTKEEASVKEIETRLPDELYDKEADYSWYNFDDYLMMQLKTHTTAYDPKAGDDEWVGHFLLAQAKETFGEEVFVIKDVVKFMDLKDLKGFEDSYIIDTTDYHKLLRQQNPFKGSKAQSLIDAYE